MPRSPQWMDLYQIWFRGGGPLADVINRAEFCCSRLMGFESVRGQNSLLGDVLVGNHPFVIFAVLDVSFAVVSKPQFFFTFISINDTSDHTGVRHHPTAYVTSRPYPDFVVDFVVYIACFCCFLVSCSLIYEPINSVNRPEVPMGTRRRYRNRHMYSSSSS